MTFEEIVAQLRKGNYAPVYVLTGSEPWFADYITNYIAQHALKEEEKAFNQTILYGRDTNVTDLIHTARRYPMMAPRQVVILREAQDLEDFDKMEAYFKAYAPTTILAISYKYKSIDKRTTLWKSLKNKEFVILETKKLYDNQVAPWLNIYLKRFKMTIEPKATAMLVENLGTGLDNIIKAVEKLKVAPGSDHKHITAQQVEKYIGFSKDFNAFELQNALIRRDVVKANRIALAFGKNPKNHPIQATIGALFSFFSKLMLYLSLTDKSKSNVASSLKINPFFVKDYEAAARTFPIARAKNAISLLREYDMRSKGFNNNSADHGDLLREMIFKMLH